MITEVPERLAGQIVVSRLLGSLERPGEPAAGMVAVADQVVADQPVIERGPARTGLVGRRVHERLGALGQRCQATGVVPAGPEPGAAVLADQLTPVVVLDFEEVEPPPLLRAGDGFSGGDRVRGPAGACRAEVVVNRGLCGGQREPPGGWPLSLGGP